MQESPLTLPGKRHFVFGTRIDRCQAKEELI